MSEFRQKWAVASFFESLDNGFEFDYTDNPLHVTLAGVFASKMSGLELSKILENTVSDTKPFKITAKDEKSWGNIKVMTLEKSEKFNELYWLIQSKLIKKGAEFNEPQYLKEGFTPHCTNQKNSRLYSSDIVEVNSVSLVDMFPDSNGYKRRVLKTINLSSND